MIFCIRCAQVPILNSVVEVKQTLKSLQPCLVTNLFAWLSVGNKRNQNLNASDAVPLWNYLPLFCLIFFFLVQQSRYVHYISVRSRHLHSNIALPVTCMYLRYKCDRRSHFDQLDLHSRLFSLVRAQARRVGRKYRFGHEQTHRRRILFPFHSRWSTRASISRCENLSSGTVEWIAMQLNKNPGNIAMQDIIISCIYSSILLLCVS